MLKTVWKLKRKKEDSAKAVEMRNRAMETMRSIQKRKDSDEVKDVENAQPKRKSHKEEWWGHIGVSA